MIVVKRMTTSPDLMLDLLFGVLGSENRETRNPKHRTSNSRINVPLIFESRILSRMPNERVIVLY
jgi:hypothetical protein